MEITIKNKIFTEEYWNNIHTLTKKEKKQFLKIMKDEVKKKMSEITDLIEQCRVLKKEINKKNKKLNTLKEDIREFMIDSGIKEIEGVEIRRSFTFDQPLFLHEQKEIAADFKTEETITTINIKFDKKGLEKTHPELYRKYLIENTPRLYGI